LKNHHHGPPQLRRGPRRPHRPPCPFPDPLRLLLSPMERGSPSRRSWADEVEEEEEAARGSPGLSPNAEPFSSGSGLGGGYPSPTQTSTPAPRSHRRMTRARPRPLTVPVVDVFVIIAAGPASREASGLRRIVATPTLGRWWGLHLGCGPSLCTRRVFPQCRC
jgi:hypothetical protein